MTLRQIRTVVRVYAAITLAVTVLMVVTVTALPLEILLVRSCPTLAAEFPTEACSHRSLEVVSAAHEPAFWGSPQRVEASSLDASRESRLLGCVCRGLRIFTKWDTFTNVVNKRPFMNIEGPLQFVTAIPRRNRLLALSEDRRG